MFKFAWRQASRIYIYKISRSLINIKQICHPKRRFDNDLGAQVLQNHCPSQEITYVDACGCTELTILPRFDERQQETILDTSCEPCGSSLRLTTSKELVQLRQTHYLSPPRTCPKQFQFSRKWEWKIKELAHWSHKSKRYPNVSGSMFHKIGGLSVTHHCCPEKYLSKIAPCMTPPHWTSSKPQMKYLKPQNPSGKISVTRLDNSKLFILLPPPKKMNMQVKKKQTHC